MTLVQVAFLGIGPAALAGLAGIFVRSRLTGKTTTALWSAFLLSALAVLFVSLILAGSKAHGPEVYGLIILPATLGTLAALLVHVGSNLHIRSKVLAKRLPLAFVVVALCVIAWATNPSVTPAIIVASLIIALGWQVSRRPGRRLIVGASLALVWLLVYSTMVLSGFEPSVTDVPRWLQAVYGVVVFLLTPGVVVILAGRLVYASLGGVEPVRRWAAASYLALMALLLLAVGYLIVAESIWDGAEDGLAGIALAQISSLVGIAVAVLLAWASAGWRRLAALGFAVLVPALMFTAFQLGWQVSHLELTEGRAERLNRALQSYHGQNGRYPAALADLTPWYTLYIPNPVILRGQTWCYEGGEDYYRLGYVYQPGFGAPPQEISIRIHQARGVLPDPGWPCDHQLQEVRSRSPWH